MGKARRDALGERDRRGGEVDRGERPAVVLVDPEVAGGRRLAHRVRRPAVEHDDRDLALALDLGRVGLDEHVAVDEERVEVLPGRRRRRRRSGRRRPAPTATAGFTTTAFQPCASAMPSSAAALPRASNTVGTTGAPRLASSSR